MTLEPPDPRHQAELHSAPTRAEPVPTDRLGQLAIPGFIALFVLTYYPLLQTGFADHDSMFMAIRYWTEPSYFAWLPKLAQLQGRWHYYYDGVLWILPFLSQGFVYYKVVTISALVLNALVFYAVIARITRAGSFAQFALMMYLLSLQFGGNHSALTGYFVYKHVGMLCVALSLFCFHEYLQSRRVPWLVPSAAFFALAVPVHETFSLYALVHVALLVANVRRKAEGFRPKMFLPLAPFTLIVVAYVGATLAYRAEHPSQYAGNTFESDALSVPRYAESIFVLTRSAFPAYFFFDDKIRTIYDHYAPGFAARSSDASYIRGDMRAAWALRAMVFAGLCVLILRRSQPMPRGMLMATVSIAILLTLIPNALLSFSLLYQNYALNREWIGTHMTYLAGYGVALLLASVLWAPMHHLAHHTSRIVRALALTTAAFAVAFVSVITDFSNHYTTKMLGMQHQKWVAMDRFLESEVFQSIPEGEVIFSPDLWGAVYNPYYHLWDFQGGHLIKESYIGETYWAKYIRAKTGRRIWVFGQWMFLHGFLKENPDPGRRFFHLRYAQEPAEPRQFIAVGEVKELDREHTDRVTILSLSIPEPWTIAFNSADGTHVLHTHTYEAGPGGVQLARDGAGQFTVTTRGIDLPTLVVTSSQIDANRDTR